MLIHFNFGYSEDQFIKYVLNCNKVKQLMLQCRIFRKQIIITVYIGVKT